MAISSVSSGIQTLPQANANAAKVTGSLDADKDGSRPDEAEKAQPSHRASSSGTLGTVIDTTA